MIPAELGAPKGYSPHTIVSSLDASPLSNLRPLHFGHLRSNTGHLAEQNQAP